MNETTRISVEEARTKTLSGEALLVCAYEPDEKHRMNNLEGSISFNEFTSRLPGLPKDQEIIFYWAWKEEASAAGRAAKLMEDGYTNVKVLLGGVKAWKEAGNPVIG